MNSTEMKTNFIIIMYYLINTQLYEHLDLSMIDKL